MVKNEYRICTRCVMDTSDPDIRFNEDGTCHHCSTALKTLELPPFSLSDDEKKIKMDELVKDVKHSSKGMRYDCIIGLSGGIDSTYTAYIVRELGLNPLAIHLDNGWDSELAVKNIENICKCLDIDLYTHVIDWEEFKDIQLSFLKASTPDSEIPSDHAIRAIMYQMAEKERVKYILAGTNHATESILPPAWSRGHDDWIYIKSVQKQFGSQRIRTFPHMSRSDLSRYNNKKKIKWISLLDYVIYDKTAAKELIIEKLGWQDYGGKHHESKYTKFFQTYILPTKFGYDKRRAHLSSLIVTGQMTREQALEEMKKSPYNEETIQEDIKYAVKKLGLTIEEFERIMNLPKKTIFDYPRNDRMFSVRLKKKVFRVLDIEFNLL